MIKVERVAEPTDEVAELIDELEASLAMVYTPEQRHGLSLDALFQPHIGFFLARLDGVAAGCGGIALFPDYAEVKRMFVRQEMRGRGIARALLTRIEAEASAAGYSTLHLETGKHQLAALRLYEAAGFHRRGAFGAYSAMTQQSIATSIFLEKQIIPIT